MSKIITDKNKIKEVLTKGVEAIYPRVDKLADLLSSGKRIRLYTGYDPTAHSLHIGHAVTLRKLAQFQRLGHEIIMLIGDFTGMIGDPDKMSARPALSRAEVRNNMKAYKEQAGKIINFSGSNAAKVKFNSRWNDKLTFVKLIDLASKFTVQQMLAREMFQQRLKKEKPIYLHEFLYPLAQAYDSVVMDVDLEVGGNDQTFNMLRGRDLMKELKNKEKFVLTTKLLVDPTGKKMGKTEGNMVNLSDKPGNIYGQIMSWPDSLIWLGFELCTDFSMDRIKRLKAQKNNPRDDKARLAKEIITIHFSGQLARKAESEFNKVFRESKVPDQLATVKIKKNKISILDLLVETKLVDSKAKARRLVKQGGIKLNGQPQTNWQVDISLKSNDVLQVGKRRFVRLI